MRMLSVVSMRDMPAAQAKEFAEQTRIELVDRVRLMQLLEEYKVTPR